MRRGRGKSATSLQLIEAAYEILEEIQPATVRAVAYRLFTMGLMTSMSSKSELNKVSRQLVYARENGDIPWKWIVDDTRKPERVPSWADPHDFMATVQQAYRRDFWQHQSNHVEVWSEKGTVHGILSPVLREYGVTFRVLRGFASATAIMDAAGASGNGYSRFVALYVGDWDPSGLYMSCEDLPNRLYRYDGQVELTRIALLQGDLQDLPSFPADTKRGDTRYKWFMEHYGDECWELDAMSPVDLRERVEQCIVNEIDQEAWERSAKCEAAEQDSLKTVLDAWAANGGKPQNNGGGL